MKVWLKRQGHRVGGKLPGAPRVVNGHSAWQQSGGVGTALQGSGGVTEEPCGCEQAVAPLANPECYASYIGDIRSVLSFDSRCPPL